MIAEKKSLITTSTGGFASRGRTAVGTLFVLTLILSPILATGEAAAQSGANFGQQQQGRLVYDRADVLKASGEERVAREARQLQERTGTPTVVYLREQQASYSETEDDAQELMSAWDVESSEGARDGLVAFVNLDPPAGPGQISGQVSLYSGAELARGPLPQPELQRISDEEVLPLLREDDPAGGLSAGLQAAAQQIQGGGEAGGGTSFEPSPVAATLAGLPAIIFALAAGTATVLFVGRLGADSRLPHTTVQATERTSPPSDLSPTLASRLAGQGSYHDRFEATILDLSRRGALALEPDDEYEEWDPTEPDNGGSSEEAPAEGAFRLRLLDESLLDSDHERAVWRRLQWRADERGVVAGKDLPGIATRDGDIEEALREELQHRGLFDRQAPARRMKLYLAAAVAALLAAVVGAVAAGGHQPLGLVAVAILAGAAIYALTQAIGIPDATSEGQRQIASWHGYLEGLRSAGRDHSRRIDLDEATPYAAAFGIAVVLEDRLQEASDRGEAPAWFADGEREDEHEGERHADRAALMAGGFAPYWFSFHGSCARPTGTAGAAGGGFIGAGGGVGGGAGAGGAGGGGAEAPLLTEHGLTNNR